MFATSLVILAAASVSQAQPPSAASNRDFLVRNYPRPSLEQGEQGPVAFEVTVEPDGFMSTCVIKASSGFLDLDRGTCEFLARYGKMKPAADAEGHKVRSIHEGRINWRLPAGSVRPVQVRLASATADRLELQCRRFNKTGTRSRKVKVCMTVSEWAYQDQVLRDELNRGLKAPGISR